MDPPLSRECGGGEKGPIDLSWVPLGVACVLVHTRHSSDSVGVWLGVHGEVLGSSLRCVFAKVSFVGWECTACFYNKFLIIMRVPSSDVVVLWSARKRILETR